MPFDYHKTLDSISAKTRLLLERYGRLVQERDEAKAQVESLQKQIEQMQKEHEQLRMDNHYLRMAATLAPKREDVERRAE